MDFPNSALKVLGNVEPNAQNLRFLDSGRGKLIPFVGAGLSMHFGYPSWNTLLQDLAEEVGIGAQVRDHIAQLQFEEAAELIADASPNYMEDKLASVFDLKKIVRPIQNGAVRYLPAIAKGPVLTTNFDRVLEAAFQDAGRPFAESFNGARIREATHAIQFDEPFLLKLHGDYRDSEHRVLTLTEYAREYGSTDPVSANLDLPLPTVLGQALASRPMMFLGCSLRNDRTLAVISRIARRYSGIVHFALLPDSDRAVARTLQLYSWNIRPIFYRSGQYSQIEEFLACLATFTGTQVERGREGLRSPTVTVTSSRGSLVHQGRAPTGTRHRIPRRTRVYINGYKLFYFRMTRKLSISDLSHLSGVSQDLLRQVESVEHKPEKQGIRYSLQRFKQCNRDVLTKLERALQVWGQLEAGKADDSLSMYVQFYFTYKGPGARTLRASNQLKLLFQTKVMVFDFDGTLTKRTDNRTTWEKIWVSLGYSIDDCANLHRRFSRGELTHQKWCELTTNKFKLRTLREERLKKIARDIQLVPGTKDTLESLKKNGIRLYVLSGSIKQVIKLVLGDLYDLFDEVKANEIEFDGAGVIKRIIGTRYDFQGKAAFLSNLIYEQALSPLDVLFIGNSVNDIWASQSGARTLCVNPHMTNPDIEEHWSYAIKEMTNLRQILEYVRI